MNLKAAEYMQINWGESDEMKFVASGTKSNFQGRYRIKKQGSIFKLIVVKEMVPRIMIL